jgi:hypothetical protein
MGKEARHIRQDFFLLRRQITDSLDQCAPHHYRVGKAGNGRRRFGAVNTETDSYW